MPGLLSKIFRRKKGAAGVGGDDPSSPGVTSPPSRNGKKSGGVGRRRADKNGSGLKTKPSSSKVAATARADSKPNIHRQPLGPKDEEDALQSPPSVSGTISSGRVSTNSYNDRVSASPQANKHTGTKQKGTASSGSGTPASPAATRPTSNGSQSNPAVDSKILSPRNHPSPKQKNPATAGDTFGSPTGGTNNGSNGIPTTTGFSKSKTGSLPSTLSHPTGADPRNGSYLPRRGPVDLDDTDFEESDLDENRERRHYGPDLHPPSGLSFQQLQQFNQQQQQQNLPTSQQRTHQQLYVMSESRPTKMAEGQLRAMEDMADQSEGSTSDFNLSTDAEDEEYNTLKRRVAATTNGPPLPGMEPAMLLDNSGPTPVNYTTDEDRVIFPALNTDNEESSTEPTATTTTANTPQQTPDDEPGRIKIVSMAHETEDDMRAWGLSPSMSSTKENGDGTLFSKTNNGNNNNNGNNYPFDGVTASASGPAGGAATATTPSSSIASSRKTYRQNGNDPHGFADFANFDNFDNAFPDSALPSPSGSRGRSVASTQQQSSMVEDEASYGRGRSSSSINGTSTRQHRHSSSASAANPDTSLSDLLAQAKQATTGGSSRRREQQRNSSHSVNSAPAITAQYLRQHHGLRSASNTRSSVESRSSAEPGTPVSDIIQNLEATNASRLRNSSKTRSHRSVGSRESANASVRSAKERIRERRRREREGSTSRRHRSRSSASEVGSDHSSDNDVSENWLFDEVTGALGPRGVAADMESLSGRSNRSKNSTGNKSHRSHRSHRSHKSSSRRRKKSSSNESVDSKNSRNSRNSRYSHRSTRSYLSQMSEQSRSVANDLLRLEMQLAMVGSADNTNSAGNAGVPGTNSTPGIDDGHGRSGGSVGGSISGTSRTGRSRRSTTIARRTKITVVAPPGKLGIILANKADSKGTVVSGVRTSSVLADKISPGDRIVAIDGEDVSRMTVSEITTIMARKSEFERTLTVLSTPKPVARSGGSATSRAEEYSYSSSRR